MVLTTASMAGRSSSWAGDVGDVANIFNDHITTFSEVVYGEKSCTDKVEPKKIEKFKGLWVALQKLSPNLSFKQKDHIRNS